MEKTESFAPHVPERIVIVGGGFAGVTLAQRLERLLPVDMEIVVLSAENHLVFTPMLPEVVEAQLWEGGNYSVAVRGANNANAETTKTNQP